MKNSIKELILSNTQTPILDMIPIFIGQQQTFVESVPTFTDSLNSHISLPNDSINQIDLTSISLSLKYWKQICPANAITNSGTSVIIPFNITIPTLLDTTCIFVVYDNGTGQILFTSPIDSYNSNLTTLNYITLKIPLQLTGFLYTTIIKNVTEKLNFTLDIDNNGLTPLYDITYTSSVYNPGTSLVNVSIKASLISYNISPITFKITYFTNITIQNEILKAQQYLYGADHTNIPLTTITEANPLIRIGLSYSQNAIVINYHDDTQLQNLLDTLDKIANIGYFIVPLDLSSTTVQTLIDYVKAKEKLNTYFSILVPSSVYKFIAYGSGGSIIPTIPPFMLISSYYHLTLYDMNGWVVYDFTGADIGDAPIDGDFNTATVRFVNGMFRDTDGSVYFVDQPDVGFNWYADTLLRKLVFTSPTTGSITTIATSLPSTFIKYDGGYGVGLTPILEQGIVKVGDYLYTTETNYQVIFKTPVAGGEKQVFTNMSNFEGGGGTPFGITLNNTNDIYFTNMNQYEVDIVNGSGTVSLFVSGHDVTNNFNSIYSLVSDGSNFYFSGAVPWYPGYNPSWPYGKGMFKITSDGTITEPINSFTHNLSPECQTLNYYNNNIYYAYFDIPLVRVYNLDMSLNRDITLKIPLTDGTYNSRNILITSLQSTFKEPNNWRDRFISKIFAHPPTHIDVITGFHDYDTVLTWTDSVWPITINEPITSFSFTQDSFIPDVFDTIADTGVDIIPFTGITPTDLFTISATSIVNGEIQLTITITGGPWYSMPYGHYNCTAIVNGISYHAILTIEFYVVGS